MPLRDNQRGDWVSDIKALLDVNQKVAYDLHSLLCNIVCHRVLEQLIENPELQEFVIPLAPIGEATLYKDSDGIWKLRNLKAGNSFVKAVDETIRCKESRLYRDVYDKAYDQLVKNLKRFASENIN